MTTWKEVIKFINNKKLKETFTPKEIRMSMGYNSPSVLSYMNYLRQAMFLKRIKAGVYYRNRMIPEDLKLTKIKKFVYNNKNYKQRENNIKLFWQLHDLKDKINDK